MYPHSLMCVSLHMSRDESHLFSIIMRLLTSRTQMSRAVGLMNLLAAAACSSAGEPAPPVTRDPKLTVLSARSVDDTVGATGSLVSVEYTDETGVRKAGAVVRFAIAMDSVSAARVRTTGESGELADAITDGQGRASAYLVFLLKAGTGRVRVSVVGTSATDSVQFRVRPGKAVRFTVLPRDTAALVDRPVQFSAQSFDQWDNRRTDTFVWSSSSSAVAIGSTGEARGSRFARAVVRASADGYTDSSYLSVVPRATIAAVWVPTTVGTPSRFEVFDTDGSNRTQIPIARNPQCSAFGLVWRATGDDVLFAASDGPGCGDLHIYKGTLPGPQSRVTVNAGTVDERWPSYSPDGQFIYFSARFGGQDGELWRMRTDGSSPQRVGPATTAFWQQDQWPSLSADGSTILFASNRTTRAENTIQLLDLAAGAARESGLAGSAPRWSPQQDRIAFHTNNREYAVASANGAGLRVLSRAPFQGMPAQPSWSPDGRWIVTPGIDPKASAPAYGRLELIEVETGLVLPLGWTSLMGFPAWKP